MLCYLIPPMPWPIPNLYLQSGHLFWSPVINIQLFLVISTWMDNRHHKFCRRLNSWFSPWFPLLTCSFHNVLHLSILTTSFVKFLRPWIILTSIFHTPHAIHQQILLAPPSKYIQNLTAFCHPICSQSGSLHLHFLHFIKAMTFKLTGLFLLPLPSIHLFSMQ